MFKAKLIEDLSYYQLKRKQLLSLLLFLAIPTPIIFIFHPESGWIMISLIAINLGLYIYFFHLQKSMKTKINHQTIEMDAHQIRLLSKQKESQKIIELKDVDKILLKEAYAYEESSGESFKGLAQELKGDQIQNFIILEKDDQQEQFNFIVESHYMLKQLNKIIGNWQQKGYLIEKI